jgi:exonuclease III
MPTKILHTYKITTININGIASSTEMQMLVDFVHKNYVDIAILQEVTHGNFDSLRGYKAIVNEGT